MSAGWYGDGRPPQRGGLRDDSYLGDVSIVSRVQTLVQRCRSSGRVQRELDNIVNYRWYYGQPWYIRSPDLNRIVGLAPDKRQKYVYVNKTFEVVRTLKGVMYYDPDVEARPRSVDAEDVARAQMAMALGKNIIENGNLAEAWSKVIDLTNICGLGWIKAYWDPNGGGRRPVLGQQVCPQCLGEGALQGIAGSAPCWYCSAQGLVPSPQGWKGTGVVDAYVGDEPEGEVKFAPVAMDDVFIDPEAETLDAIDEVAIRTRMPKGRAWEMYGKGLGISEEEFDTGGDEADPPMIINRLGLPYTQPADRTYCRVYEYYQKPTEKHPEGVFGVQIGSREVVAGRLPYLHDREPFPIFPFPMYEMIGSLYPMSTVDVCLPLIIAYNDHLTNIHARARMSAKLRFMVPRTTAFEVSDKDGNVFYTPTPQGHAPKELQIGNPPSDAADMINILGQAIESTSAASSILQGMANGADSARAMAFREERSVGPLKPIMSRHARQLDRVVKYGIDLARMFYKDGRLMRIAGAEGGLEVREFRVENVGESTDVKLATVRNVGRSRATLMAELNEAADRQMVDPETYQQLAQFGDMGDLHKKRMLHRNHATMENQLLLRSGQMPPPRRYQNHKEHRDVHQAKLVELQTTDPNHPAIAMLEQHLDMTTQVEAEEQFLMQSAQMQAAQKYGLQNAASPQAGGTASQEPVNPAPPGEPETQDTLADADARAQSVDTQGAP